MADVILPSKPIAEFDPYNDPIEGDLLPIVDTRTGKTKKIDIKYFIPAPPSTSYNWVSTFPYAIDDVVEYQGKWYVSTADPNTGNIPGSPGAPWDLVNKAQSGFVYWTPGVYTGTDVIVLRPLDLFHQLFRLTATERPFNSSDFEKEYSEGAWELMSERGYLGISRNAHGFAVNDVLTYKASAWNKFTTGDVPLAIVRQVVSVDLVIIVILGNRLKGLSGRSAGSIYYAQADGSISTVVSPNPIYIAIASDEAVLLSSGGGSSSSGPSVVISETYTNIAALLADQGDQDTGLWYMVTDASADTTVDIGWAIYQKLGTSTAALSDYLKTAEQESLDVIIVDASPTTKGILKLYGTTGANSDGTITQGVISAELNLKSDALWTVTQKVASYTLAAAELTVINAGGSLVMESTTGDLTVPPNATVAFPYTPKRTTIAVRGFANIIATGGVTVTGTNGTLVIPANRTCILEKTAVDTWILHNGPPVVSTWSTTEAGLVIESTTAQAENVATGASTASTTGLSQARAVSEIGLYYFIRKVMTLAWTWSIGPTITDATADTVAVFSSAKKLVSAAAANIATLAEWITGTNNTKFVTVASFLAFRQLTRISVSLASTTVTLNASGRREARFITTTAHVANFTIALDSTMSDCMEWDYVFPVTGTVIVTLPTGSKVTRMEQLTGRLTALGPPKQITLVGVSGSTFRFTFNREDASNIEIGIVQDYYL